MNNPNQGGQNQGAAGGQGGSRTSSPAKAVSRAAADSRSPASRTRSPVRAASSPGQGGQQKPGQQQGENR